MHHSKGAVGSIVVALTIVSLAEPAAAFGYRDTGHDPMDRPDPTAITDRNIDVRSTTRKVRANEDGRAWLSITFRTHAPIGGGPWRVYVSLDTRGGPLAEHRMKIVSGGGMSPPYGFVCWIRRAGATTYRKGKVRIPDLWEDNATCTVPLRWVEPNKRIRWRLYSPGEFLGTEPAIDEYVPDHGWLP